MIGAQAMEAQSFRSLHRLTVDDPEEVLQLLSTVKARRVSLRSGIDGQINQRKAEISAIGSGRLLLRAQHLESERLSQIYFQFDLGGRRYFFAADVTSRRGAGEIEVRLPPAIHEVERRSLPRVPVVGGGRWVELGTDSGRYTGSVVDQSYEGAAVEFRGDPRCDVGSRVTLIFEGGSGGTGPSYGLVRNRAAAGELTRLGLSVSQVPFQSPISVERRAHIIESTLGERARRELRFYGSTLGVATGRLTRALGVDAGSGQVEVLHYRNDRGQPMVAIVDRVGSVAGGTAVIVPPAWGRTKETMLPLAAVICETFAAAGEPILVVRFDGTNRRGESWIDPECRAPGSEYLHFRFSQSVNDIQATVRFIKEHHEFRPGKIVLVTASLASVEGRKGLATDRGKAISGWISLVGMVDLHSGLRSASGGVDYAFGLQKGVAFGRHELAGVVADMDLTGRDVLEHGLGLFEDARRDMAAIDVPVTWIHGRHDGWMDLERVRELMSAGTLRNRRLIEVPTGHQLRSSRQAMETFQLVAQEIGRMTLGRALEPAVPRGRYLEAKQRAERARRPAVASDFKAFWSRYVLGREGQLGIEILAATQAYRLLMEEQISQLRLSPGNKVADLGSGAGDFAASVGHQAVQVVAVDFLPAALRRGRERARRIGVDVASLVADLDDGRIPLASESFDGVLASLLISYVASPEGLIREMRRILRPGGRIVVSCPRRDADLSKIYVEGVRELDPGTVRAVFGQEAERQFGQLQRDLLNEGARLLSLEEEGWFRFRDPEELADLVAKAGFEAVEAGYSFGDPPQVSLVAARRL